MDLITLVEEYKQHAIHSDVEICNLKSHIHDLEKEILKLRTKDGQHFSFVRELEESVRSLDNQLRQSHLSCNRKDNEIKLFKQKLSLAEHDFDRRASIESHELLYLREEKKRLLQELSMRDHQLTEFEKQIDHQQTSILNLKVGDKEGTKVKVSPQKSSMKDDAMQLRSSDINLYPIRESQSPSASPNLKVQSGQYEGRSTREWLHSDVEVDRSPEQPHLASSSSLESSPLSGKVELIDDESEFRGELNRQYSVIGTIFTEFSSPSRVGTTAARKWASPREEEEEKDEILVRKSPSKPNKPIRPQKPLKIPLHADIDPLTSKSEATPTTATGRGGKNTTRELDSGTGLHQALERQEYIEEKYKVGQNHNQPGTPDTLSPPPSPEGRISRAAAEVVEMPTRRPPPTRSHQLPPKDDDITERDDVHGARAKGRERRMKTLASIRAIMHKSRVNRPADSEAPLPADMSFEKKN